MSSRARGRTHRTGDVVEGVNHDSYDPGPGSGEGDAIGESELTDPAGSPIPGGQNHIVNYETKEHPVPSPAPPPAYDGMMAHGVPAEPRSDAMQIAAERGSGRKAGPVTVAEPPARPPAVPVYLVETEGGKKVIRSASPQNINVPNNASDAKLIAGINPMRVRLGLLNEDSTTDVRFAKNQAGTVNGGGALLPHAQSSYVWLETQDELYAVTSSATLSVKISVIEEDEQGA